MTRYEELLASLRKTFPSPVSDPVQDGYVVFSILRALDQIDARKTDRPILGQWRENLDSLTLQSEIAPDANTIEQVIPKLVDCFEGVILSGHPRSQMNVFANPSIPSIIGVVLSSLFTPNLCSDEGGGGVSHAEVRTAGMVAEMIGFDPDVADGVFTFGGTGALLYGAKIGLEKAIPGSLVKGLQEPAVILSSEHSHSACLNVAGWLGIGQQSLVRVPTGPDNSVDVKQLETAARQAIGEGKKIAAIVATMGTTDAFGIDDLAAIYAMRERLVDEFSLDYRPHIHADAVIGWAWSVFRDYDYDQNPLGLSRRTVRAIAVTMNRISDLRLADSVGVDFHKTGFAPYISSLVVVRDQSDFALLARDRETMPYLFHSGSHQPGLFTLETSRGAAGPMSALASMLLLGREGFQTLLGHGVEVAECLREEIGGRPELTVMNDQNFGPVTLFRAYATGVDTFEAKERERSDAGSRDQLLATNRLNERIYDRIHHDALTGQGVALGLTKCYRKTDYGEPIVALKSFVHSPFAEPEQMKTVVHHVLQALADEEQAEGER